MTATEPAPQAYPPEGNEPGIPGEPGVPSEPMPPDLPPAPNGDWP